MDLSQASLSIRIAFTAMILATGAVLAYLLYDLVGVAEQGLHQWYVAIWAFGFLASISVFAFTRVNDARVLKFDARRRSHLLDLGLLSLGAGFVVAILFGESGSLYITSGFWLIVLHGYVCSLVRSRGWIRGEIEPAITLRSSLIGAGVSFILLLASVAIGVEKMDKPSGGYTLTFQLWFSIWFLGLLLMSLYSALKLATRRND